MTRSPIPLPAWELEIRMIGRQAYATMSAMSRDDDLAAAFERANRDLIDYLTCLVRARWRTRAVNGPLLRLGDEDENRPVGTIAHHVAMGYRRTISGLTLLAAGEPLPRPDSGRNADHAAEHPD